MGEFIKTVDGAYALSSEIVEIKDSGHAQCTIATKQGKVHKVKANGADLRNDIERKSFPIIEAQPGYSVAYLTGEIDEAGSWKKYVLPVIAWRFIPNDSGDDFPYDTVPLVAGSPPLYIGGSALVLPDGMVKTKYSELPMTVEEWIEAVKDFIQSVSEEMEAIFGEEDDDIDVDDSDSTTSDNFA